MSASKIHSTDCLKVRQTMFQFLKRKKHTQLQKSIKQYSSSNKKQHEQNKTSIHKRDTHSRARSSVIYDDMVLQEHDTIPLVSIKKNRFNNNNNSSITPRKITFAGDQFDQKQQVNKKSQKYRKPLIEMISPIKNKTSNKKNQSFYFKQKYYQKSYNQRYNKRGQSMSRINQRGDSTNRNSQRGQNNKSSLKSNILKKNNTQIYTKRKITQSLNNLQQVFEKMFNAGKTARDKNNQLSIALINFVKDIQKSRNKQNFNIEKKLGQIKYILNAINSSLQLFANSSQAQSLIQQFHKHFNQHLNQIQSANNHNIKMQYQQSIIKINTQKQFIIDQLNHQNNQLTKQIQKLNRFIQKNQQQFQSQLQHQAERQQNLLQTIQSLKRQISQNQQINTQKVNQLQKILIQQKQNNKNLQKQLKQIIYRQQKSINQSIIQKAEQAATRQAFLLNQMEKLRHTFNSDISQLHKLYQSKQLQYQQKIQNLNHELDKQIYQRKCDRQVSDKILSQANINRAEVFKVTKKNQQLVQDLYRINQDLFQHWLALKDVKTLSERLHIFQHFERIYLDLAFNPNLFRI